MLQGLSMFLWGDLMEYISVTEAAVKWGLSRRRVLTLCAEDRIPGVSRLGSIWMIPKDAEKPADARIKSGRYIGYTKTKKLSSLMNEGDVSRDGGNNGSTS